MKKSLLFLCASLLGAGLIATLAVRRGTFNRLEENQGVQSQPRIQVGLKAIEEKRKVYPYSIVPGGALTVEEARRAMSNPAVRIHYAAVDLKKLRQVTLTADLSGYVSYRFGDKIYWTAKTIRLKAGETIFTDGQHIVRGRCLNCYSVRPMTPIRPKEPAEIIMDTPVEVPAIAVTFPRLPLEAGPVLAPPESKLGPVLPSRSVAPGRGGGGKFFPIIPIIPPIHRRKPTTPNTPLTPEPPPPTPPPPTPPPPVAVVPEPQYRGVMAAMLVAIAVSGFIRKQIGAASYGALTRSDRSRG